MKVMLLVPGTGHSFCGSCLRDDALGRALGRLGHDVEVVPLYLPLVVEEPRGSEPAVHMGGINVFLQQKTALARRLPRWLADLLDRPGLLRWASRRGSLTAAPALGAMTLSMLRGEHGQQALELEKLVAWVAAAGTPDVIVLSNALLSGAARRLKAALRCAVVVTLQGEAPFLDALPAPFQERAWDELRANAAAVDVFVAVSRWYGALMAERLGVEPERVRVVDNGIDLRDLRAEPAPLAERSPPAVGYLARLCRDKGLPTLVEAFSLLAAKGAVPGVRLRVAGALLREDRPLVDDVRARLRARGLEDRAELRFNIERHEKLALLHSLSVLSVPATYGESFGLYVLEALACGVPVVQPRHGAFPDLIEATGGGLLCAPDDPAALAAALEALLLDPVRAQEMADRGRRAVLEHFGAERMAREFEAVCRSVVA